MAKTVRKPRVCDDNIKRKMKEFSHRSLEVAILAQEVIRRRMERALYCEAELDTMMERLLKCAELCEDKATAKLILQRFQLLKPEEISKVMSVLRSCHIPHGEREETESGEDGAVRFEDLYE